jgi:hypothetical protein
LPESFSASGRKYLALLDVEQMPEAVRWVAEEPIDF